MQFKCHNSAFAGYHTTASDYSTVKCLSCGKAGRTKGDFVSALHAQGKVYDFDRSREENLADVERIISELYEQDP